MSEPFKAYVNKATFAASDDEVIINFYMHKPILQENGEIQVVLDEQGMVVLSYQYAKVFSDALSQTISNHEKSKKKSKTKQTKEGVAK